MVRDMPTRSEYGITAVANPYAYVRKRVAFRRFTIFLRLSGKISAAPCESLQFTRFSTPVSSFMYRATSSLTCPRTPSGPRFHVCHAITTPQNHVPSSYVSGARFAPLLIVSSCFMSSFPPAKKNKYFEAIRRFYIQRVKHQMYFMIL